MIQDGNIDYKGVLIGSSASVSSANWVQGISAGSLSTYGTIIFSNSNNVTFGMNASTITATVSAADASPIKGLMYPPVGYVGVTYMAMGNSGTTGNTGGASQTTASGYIGAMPLVYNLSYKNVFAVATYVGQAGTGTVTEGYLYGIYTVNASTALSLVTSYKWNVIRTQSSVTSQILTWYWGTNSTSNSTGSGGGNISANFSGTNLLLLETNTGSSLSAGQYYIGVIYTRRSGTSDGTMGNLSTPGWMDGSNTGAMVWYGQNETKALDRYVGVFSTTSNGTDVGVMVMPGSINTTALTNTGGSSQWRTPFLLFVTTT